MVGDFFFFLSIKIIFIHVSVPLSLRPFNSSSDLCMFLQAAEPAFAAVIGVLFYGKQISLGKWLMLVPIIGGAILASVCPFAWNAAPPFPAFLKEKDRRLSRIHNFFLKHRIADMYEL